MRFKKLTLLLSLLLVLSACGAQTNTSKRDGGTVTGTQAVENSTEAPESQTQTAESTAPSQSDGDDQGRGETRFDHILSHGGTAGHPYAVDKDGMVYDIFASDGQFRLTNALTKEDDPAVMADVGSTQVVFMLADGTLKYHGLVRPALDDDEDDGYGESFTIAKLDRDKVKALYSGSFGVFAVLDTDNRLFGAQLSGGAYEVFSKKDDWIQLDRFNHTEAHELTLITDDVKTVRLLDYQMLVLKNNGDLIRYDMDDVEGVKIASGITEIGKVLLFDAIGLKEDGSIQPFMSEDFRIEGTFDSIKYDIGNPILTKGDDDYTIFINDSEPQFENSDFFSDTKVITRHNEDGKVREEGVLQKINYNKFRALGIGRIRFIGSAYLYPGDSKSGEKEAYLQIIDEDERGFILNDKGEVVMAIDKVDWQNIFKIIYVKSLKWVN